MTWIATEKMSGLMKTLILAMAGCLATMPVQAMTLSKALELSIDHDPAVPLAIATYDAEKELGRQVSGTLLPSVSATGGYTYHDNESQSQFFGNFEESYDSFNAGIEARQPLLRMDWFARRRQSDALDAKAEAGQDDRKYRHFIRIAGRYFDVLIAQEELRLAQAEAEAIGESLADTRKRHEVGLVPGTDLKEAKARDDLARARLILARQQLSTAQDALDESTGNGYVALPSLPAEAVLPLLEPADIQVWVARASERNTNVVLAREQVNIAKSEADSASAELMPSVDAVAGYRHEDSSDSRIGSERDDTRIGLELSVPIYQGGVKRARSREAQARLAVAQADYDRILLETVRQVRQQYRELEAAYAQARALELAVASATAAEEATRNGYQAGTRTITDVLNARSAVISAQRDYSQTRYNLLLGWLQLKQLTSELDVADFERIDRILRKQEEPQDTRT